MMLGIVAQTKGILIDGREIASGGFCFFGMTGGVLATRREVLRKMACNQAKHPVVRTENWTQP
jgi:hypothetical protein